MPSYSVIWEIEVDAASPLAAAIEAQKIQRDPESTANVFDIIDEAGDNHEIDLDKQVT